MDYESYEDKWQGNSGLLLVAFGFVFCVAHANRRDLRVISPISEVHRVYKIHEACQVKYEYLQHRALAAASAVCCDMRNVPFDITVTYSVAACHQFCWYSLYVLLSLTRFSSICVQHHYRLIVAECDFSIETLPLKFVSQTLRNGLLVL